MLFGVHNICTVSFWKRDVKGVCRVAVEFGYDLQESLAIDILRWLTADDGLLARIDGFVFSVLNRKQREKGGTGRMSKNVFRSLLDRSLLAALDREVKRWLTVLGFLFRAES